MLICSFAFWALSFPTRNSSPGSWKTGCNSACSYLSPHQRLLRSGCSRLVSCATDGYARGRAEGACAPGCARWELAWPCRSFSIFANARWKDCQSKREKAPQLASGRLGCKILVQNYFPFLGDFFSSFLAFFFMRISSSVWVEDRRQCQPLACTSYTSRTRQSQANSR